MELQNYYKSNSGLGMPDVKANFDQVTTQERLTIHTDNHKKHGGWKDEQDVKNLFQDKPGRAWNSFRNAKRFLCPVHKVLFYEVPSYTSEVCNGKTEQETGKLECRQDAVIPAEKKARKALPARTPRWTAGTKKKVCTLADRIYARILEAEDLLFPSGGAPLSKRVPKLFVEQLIASKEACYAQLKEMTRALREAGSAAEVIESGQSALESLEYTTQRAFAINILCQEARATLHSRRVR